MTEQMTEQMIGTMQQLLQAKSADGGHQVQKSGGSGRGETAAAPKGHRAKKGLLAQGLLLQQLLLQGKEYPTTAAERRMDQDLPTTLAGNQSFLAGVGPMINIQRGETRNLFLVGMAAHDGDCVLSSVF